MRAVVCREAPNKGPVEMGEAENATAAYARAALEQVDAATTLIAVGGQLRIPEDSKLGHWMRISRTAHTRAKRDTPSRSSHDTHRRVEVRWVRAVEG